MRGLISVSSSVAQPAPDTVYHLHGSVVNGVTGKPVGRALVISADRRLATMTNSEGNWAIDISLPSQADVRPSYGTSGTVGMNDGLMQTGGLSMSAAGGVRLMAQRPGYLPFEDQLQVPLGARSSEAAVVLRLMPSAAVQGQVVTVGNATSRRLQVSLLHRAIADGRYVWRVSAGRSVDADGSFQFNDLQPGEYSVVTSAWMPGLAAVSQQLESQQYPATYLGDSTTLEGATKLHLGYGQTARAELHPRLSPFYAIAIPVQGIAPNTPVNVRVMQNGGTTPSYVLRWNAREARMEGTLPAGEYTVSLSALGNAHAAASVPLHVANAPVSMAAIALSPTPDIAVHVRDERSSPATERERRFAPEARASDAGFSLFFRPENENGMTGGVANRDGALVVENLAPGRYAVQASAWRGYVASVTSGRTDLLREPFTLGAGGTDPVEVTLRDDSGTVTGTIGSGTYAPAPTGAPDGVVVLLPTDGAQRLLQTHLPAGATIFTLSNVPPGSYRALIVPLQQWRRGIAYRDAEAMRAYDATGVSVTVAAGQTTSVTLPALSTLSDVQERVQRP